MKLGHAEHLAGVDVADGIAKLTMGTLNTHANSVAIDIGEEREEIHFVLHGINVTDFRRIARIIFVFFSK